MFRWYLLGIAYEVTGFLYRDVTRNERDMLAWCSYRSLSFRSVSINVLPCRQVWLTEHSTYTNNIAGNVHFKDVATKNVLGRGGGRDTRLEKKHIESTE